MMSKTIILSALLALAEARFGQEGAIQGQIQQLSSFGNPGEAGTLAGQTPGVLLAGANACAKLQLADKIVETLGDDPAVIAGAAALVQAEKNFNPFAQSIPTICSDASLPATEALRGIVALVDPAVTGSDVENANAATSLKTPFDATGLSVADVMAANGFSNFTSQGVDGAAGAAPAAGNGAAATTSASAAATTAATDCGVTITTTIAAATTATATTATAATAAATTAAVVSGSAVQKSTIAGLDYGLCVPTLKFESGLNGRKDTEFTFQAIDPLVNKGQQEALNPAIIMNRICDQLTNVCNANAAAKAACLQAKADLGGGARDVTTADAWNTQLGFAGTNTNPDNAPQAGLVGHS
ncbi:hypothetical protein CONLIGDRAFT_463808 [Coniochaeta ligniaria NRRL 30616]|uniref:Circumsporozoite protein n=1 Tax=Coniochaeta ligniaria NRRL 30616 TaxID=1408157 RepID=A0A1J7JKE9_9PEZI|nr:hypothetical protein CONLIGDRAFT_463808 [Coniochaeta ligniaria NRRL 30616]